MRGIRGVADLRVIFDYPVSVIAGENASGKSTVLLAAACTYKVPGAGIKDFVPSTLFPNYRFGFSWHEDEKSEAVITFDYATPNGRHSMRWRRAKGWNRSFLGRKNASQLERTDVREARSGRAGSGNVHGLCESLNSLGTRASSPHPPPACLVMRAECPRSQGQVRGV